MVLLEKTMELISTNIKRFLFTLIMSVIGALLLVLAIYFYEEYWNFQKETDKILKKGIDETAFVNVVDSDTTNFQNAIGYVMDNYPDMIENIGDISGYYLEDGSYFCNMGIYGLGLWNIELEEGELYTPDNIPEGVIRAIYIGYDYEGDNRYKVGNVINLDSKGQYKAIVAGRLKKGSECPDLVSIAGADSNATNAKVLLDNGYLYVHLEGLEYAHPMAMTWNDKYSIDEVKEAFVEASKVEGCDINVSPISNIFIRLNNSNRDSIEVLNKLVIIVVLSIVIMLVSVQIVAILKNKHMYGVYIVSGMKHRDTKYMIIMENVIRLILSLLITWAMVYLYVNRYIPTGKIRVDVMSIIRDYVLVKVLAVEVIIHAIATIVPIAVISKLTPVKLVEELK